MTDSSGILPIIIFTHSCFHLLKFISELYNKHSWFDFFLTFLYLAESVLVKHPGSFASSREIFWRCVHSRVVAHGLSSCDTRAPEHTDFSSCDARAQLLCGMWNLSSQTRDRTCVPCIARWILNHWTTREVPDFLLQLLGSKSLLQASLFNL